MSATSLAGRQIAVTRPPRQCAPLAAAIRERGGSALIFPLILIEPLAESPEIDEICQRLDEFDLAFFVSPNAVQHGLAEVARRRPWPAHLAVATVGEGSRRALQQHGFEHVIAPADGADSEAVLALPEFSGEALRGRRLLILRGDGGRDLLADTARERGAEVRHVTCYRRRPPAGNGAELLAAAAAGQLDALTLTSSEAVANLAALLGAPGLAALAEVPVFAPHPRIAASARQLGFTRVVLTGPGDAALLDALDAHFGSLG